MGTGSPKAIPIHLNQIRSPPRLGVRTRLFSLKHKGFCKCLAGMNIDCDEGSAKNCPPRLGIFKCRGLSTDMPEVVPFVFLMAWKQAKQPSGKSADRGRNIARLDTGDEPHDVAFQCLLPMRITIPYSWSQNRWINPLCSRVDAWKNLKSGLVKRWIWIYQLGGDLDQEFALGVRKFRPELCNRASCDAGVPIGDGS